MHERRRHAVFALGIAGLVGVALQHPRADFAIQTHARDDLAPRRVQAALDFGLASVSVLVTWSADRLR